MNRHWRRFLAAGAAVATLLLFAQSSQAGFKQHDCGQPSAFSQIAGWGTLKATGVTCRYATRLVLRLSGRVQAGADPLKLRVAGFACRQTANHDASDGADGFVKYRCARQSRSFAFTLVF